MEMKLTLYKELGYCSYDEVMRRVRLKCQSSYLNKTGATINFISFLSPEGYLPYLKEAVYLNSDGDGGSLKL